MQITSILFLGPLFATNYPITNSPLDILIDSQAYKSQIVNDNSVSKIELFIPQGKHEITLKALSDNTISFF